MCFHMAFDFHKLNFCIRLETIIIHSPLFFIVLVIEVGGSAVVVLRVTVRYGGRSTGQRNRGRVSKELKASM